MATTMCSSAGANDKFTVTTLTTVTGGGGNDTIVFGTTNTQMDYSTVTDASTGDIIDFAIGNDDLMWNSTAVVLSAQSTFAQYLDAAAGSEAVGNDIVINWFQFGGNTYLTRDVDDGTGANDLAGFNTLTPSSSSKVSTTCQQQLSTTLLVPSRLPDNLQLSSKFNSPASAGVFLSFSSRP